MRWIGVGLLTAVVILTGCGRPSAGAPAASGDTTGSTTSAPATPSPTAAPAVSDASAPGPMVSFSVGYDPVSRRLILQSGGPPPDTAATGDPQPTYSAATWAWDGHTWSQLSPATEPPPEGGASMAVDPVSGHLLLMGGDSFTETVDASGNNVPQWAPNLGTWSWDGSTWTRVADNPRQGGSPAMAVDQARNELIVDAPDIRGVLTTDGLESAGQPWYGQGLYRWTGTGWTALSGTPLGLVSAAVAYDPISRRLIYYGGNSQYPHNDTFAFDRTGWAQLHPAQYPTSGGGALAATDETDGRIVLLTYPPDNQGGPLTWTWDGSNWVRQAGAAPPVGAITRAGQMVWDPAIGRVALVLWSGSGNLQVWTWDGSTQGWVQAPG